MPPANRKNPTRAESSESDYTLVEFIREFPDDDACLEWLWRNRFAPDGEHAHCPKCETERTFKRYKTAQQRQSWTCNGCGHHIHPTAGTIFKKSSTSLHLWFYAMYLMTSTRCGISAKQLERELGVSYKTAHRMARLIRSELMTQDETNFGPEVEIDETYIGGTRRDDPAGRPAPGSHKTPVFGIVERKGRVIAVPVDNVRRATLLPIVQMHVIPASIINTDELNSYRTLGKEGFDHRHVKHSERVYVSGDVHVNTIEGFWSLVKRGIDGVYHSVSRRHLLGYLNEYAWRYNHRDDGRSQFRSLLASLTIR